MEVTHGSILVASQTKNKQVVQLYADNDLGGYYINHAKRGVQIAYEFAGRQIDEALAKYEEYAANV